VPLAELTDPAAVLRAMAEADELGRDAFLERYGFARSREYFLEHGGRLYDSKAIAGAAYGHQHPAEGPLAAEEFSGGEQTVQRKLEALGFNVVRSRSGRNPDWVVDELILALDLYLRAGLLDDTDARVIELSEQLNRLTFHALRPDAARFRNPNGVALKLANFASLDPAYGGRGMQRGGRLDRLVWDRYSGDRDLLSDLASELRDASTREDRLVSVPVEGEAEAIEGRLRYRQHFVRERDPGIAKRKREHVLRAGQRLRCEACRFDFEDCYGDLGSGFIECHHVVPLSASGVRTTRLEDLALVCSNCHRMIHRRQPWLTIAQLVEQLQGRPAAAKG
jgi:5-methylcytosine-specific restriction protein A